VTSDDGAKAWYERLTGGSLQRLPIGNAVGSVALRIGDDGQARIAYEAAAGIKFGTVGSDRVATTTIPGSAGGYAPIFVLEPGNVADVLWNRAPHGAGCAEPDGDPDDGTYFATNANGSWKSTRLSKNPGAASLTIDPASGDLIALIDERGGATAYRSADGSAWTHETVAQGDVWSAMLRVNPVSHADVLAYVVDATENGDTEVRVRTKG
jgi:hypothetical protein